MIGNLDHKIKELEHLLIAAVENYQTPEKFFTYSHSLIQNCRNLTFAIQSNKKQIPDFDTWYEPWRVAMKADRYMKWLHGKRTEVVHEDIVASKSFAILTTLPDYAEVWVERRFNYLTSTEQLIEKAMAMAIKKPALAHSVMQIERLYLVKVDDEPEELVHVLTHAFYFLHIMLEDLEIYLTSKEPYESPPLDLGQEVEKIFEPDDSYRYMRFKLKSGEPLNSHAIEIKRDEEAIKIAKQRYGSPGIQKISNMNPEDAARALFDSAKIMLQKDGSYLTMTFIHSPDGYYPMAVMFRDRSEKILFSHELATKTDELDGDAVIFIAEAWIVDAEKGQKRIDSGKEISGMRNKREVLALSMITKDGKTLSITTSFERDNGEIVLHEDIVEQPDISTFGFLLPVHRLWESKPNKRDN